MPVGQRRFLVATHVIVSEAVGVCSYVQQLGEKRVAVDNVSNNDGDSWHLSAQFVEHKIVQPRPGDLLQKHRVCNWSCGGTLPHI